MLNLARRQLERHWPFLVAVMLVLGAFEYLICAMVASIDVEGAFAQVTQFAPPFMRAMIEQNMPGGSPASILSFGWNHPVAHALLTAVAITLATRAIAGEVESGAIELILSQPLSRAQYFMAHALFGLTALCAVIAAGLLGTFVGQQVHSLSAFAPSRLALLFANALLLQAAIYAITLFASAVGREAGRVAIVGVFVALLSFLVNVLAMLWTKAAFAKPYSLHAYFEPREILVDGRLATSSVAVLMTILVVAMAAAYLALRRRDLP